MDKFLASLSLSPHHHRHLMHVDQNGYGDREKFFREFNALTQHSLDQKTLVRSLLQFAQFDPELLALLHQLKERFSLAVLTNGTSSSQRAKIKALGLDKIFSEHHLFISAEMGIAKPNRQAFDWVADALGVLACDCLYWGDQPEIDVVAAQNAGWQAHLVDGPAEVTSWLRAFRENLL